MNGVVAGRIVHYVLSDEDAKKINERRGNQPDSGNTTMAGFHTPMMIVRVFPNEHGLVNGQCLLDGSDTLWVIGKKYNEENDYGSWHWIEKA